MSKSKVRPGRNDKAYRAARIKVLAASNICHLCGHAGAGSVDHFPVSRKECMLAGRLDLLSDITNLRPAHGWNSKCYICRPEGGKACNESAKDHSKQIVRRNSRRW